MPEFTWRPANEASVEDVEAVFDAGGARKCRCQALKVPGWIWRDTTQEERDEALLAQQRWILQCGNRAFEGIGRHAETPGKWQAHHTASTRRASTLRRPQL